MPHAQTTIQATTGSKDLRHSAHRILAASVQRPHSGSRFGTAQVAAGKRPEPSGETRHHARIRAFRPTATYCQRELGSRKLWRSPLWLGRAHFPILVPLDLATGLFFKPHAPSALAAADVPG